MSRIGEKEGKGKEGKGGGRLGKRSSFGERATRTAMQTADKATIYIWTSKSAEDAQLRSAPEDDGIWGFRALVASLAYL